MAKTYKAATTKKQMEKELRASNARNERSYALTRALKKKGKRTVVDLRKPPGERISVGKARNNRSR